MQSELKKNDEIIVKIDRFGANGEGIATVDGKVIFIPFAIPGETVKIHIVNDKKNFLIAKVIEIISSSNDRVNAPCPYFTKCGGCDIQHLNYEQQLIVKTDIVKDNLSKFANLQTPVNLTISSENQFRYRNKFAFPVQEQNGELKIGMFRKNSHSIIEIEDCLLQSENTKIILKLFKEFMIENNIKAYNELTKKGDIKHIVVRENEDSFLLTVVVSNEKFNNFSPLISKLKTQFSSFGIVKNVNKLENNVILGKEDYLIFGTNELKFEEFGIKYYVNNQSFLQVNNDVKHKIYKKIIDEISDSEIIIDAYSGAGLLSSILAKNTNEVIGVEIVPEATENANKLKELNGLDNLTNINGDCAKIIPELTRKIKKDFSIVIDPPRKGIDKAVIDAICSVKPKKIVYLSCNPSTLARDLSYLKNDYEIKFVQPFDMFPQTSNVETLVSLIKK